MRIEQLLMMFLAIIASTVANDNVVHNSKHEFDELNIIDDKQLTHNHRAFIRKNQDNYKNDSSIWQCDSFDDDTNTCMISNRNDQNVLTPNITINNSKSINESSYLNVKFKDIDIACGDSKCQFIVKVFNEQAFINMTNTTIRFPVIYITTNGNLILDADSQLIASGMSNSKLGSFEEAGVVKGASHAGQGGNCLTNQYDKTYGNHYEAINLSSETNLTKFMGSVGGVNNTYVTKVYGGGIIVLESQVFSLNGNIEASGFPYNSTTYDGSLEHDQISGGSGGYILIQQHDLNAPNQTDFQFIRPINANGGWSNLEGTAGAGGRIVINVNQAVENATVPLIDQLFSTYGGINKNAGNQVCLNGAAGTIYFANFSRLFINGNDTYNNRKTPIENTEANDLNELWIQGNAIVSLVNQSDSTAKLKATNIYIKDGGELKEPITKQSTISYTSTNIECDYLEVSGKDLPKISWDVQVNKTDIQCKYINITSQGSLDFKNSLNTTFQNLVNITMQTGATINVGQFMQMFGSDLKICNLQQFLPSQMQRDIDIIESYAYIVAEQEISVADNTCTIQSDHLTMISQLQITIDGIIQPLSDQASKCQLNGTNFFSFVDSTQPILPVTIDQFINIYNNQSNTQKIGNLNQTNLDGQFTQTFIAFKQFQTNADAIIKGPRIAVFGNNIQHMGTFNSSGFGCPSGEGKGKGFFDESSQCGGQGASHAGNGGMPWNITDETDYDFCRDQIIKNGTGKSYGNIGMGPVFEGSGGGNPVAGGKGGGVVWIQSESIKIGGTILSEGTDSANQTQGGGGSGGSIVISTKIIEPDSTGKLSVKGGSSINPVGGAGSGGRVKLFRFNWKESSNYEDQGDFTITVNRDGGDTTSIVKDGRNGSMWSTPCPLGYAGFTCKTCGNGTYSNDYYDNLCNECTNMPEDTQKEERAKYLQPPGIPSQNNSDCPYECAKNVAPVATNPYCLHNFDLFLTNIGGWQIFVLLIVSVVLLVIFVLYFLFKQKKTHRIDKLIKMGEDVIMDPDFNGGRQLSSSKKIRIKDETITTALVQNNLKFFDRDIFMHFGRIYLLGSNHRNHQFQIPQQPPVQIRSKINSREYKDFIEDMNAQIKTKYSSCTHYFISLFYPALFPHYIYRKRIKSCYKLIKKFDDKFQEANFWKNEEERMRGHIQTKLSFSSNMSLCYLDFLDTRLTPDAFEGPQFPQTFVLGGEGVFHNPYELDYKTDPIIKSIGMICSDQKKWKKFLKNLNSKVATIMPLGYIWMLRQSLFDVLDYIQMSNSQLFVNDGFKISVWIIEIQDGKTENYYKMDLDYIKKKQKQFDNFLTHWSRKTLFCTKTEFKIAMVLQSDKNDLRESTQTNPMKTSRDRSFEVDSKRGSSPAPQQRISAVSLLGANLDNFDNQSGNSNDTKLTPRGGFIHRKNGNTLYNQVDSIQFITANMREPHIDQFWLKQFKQRQSSCCQDFIMFFISLAQALTLRHVVTNINIVLVIILNMILIFMDAIVTGVITLMLTQLADKKPQGMSSWVSTILFLGICPFASIVSPLLGIVSMMFCKARYYQNLAYFNTLTLLCNCILLLIYLLWNKSESSLYGISMTLYLIAVKILLAQIIPQLIAFFKNTKYAKNRDYLGLIPDFSDQSKEDIKEQQQHFIKVEPVAESSILSNGNKFKYQTQEQVYFSNNYDKSTDQAQTTQNQSYLVPSSQQHKIENQLHDSDFEDYNRTEDVPMYQRDAFSVEDELM